jgi:hypothetical protein
MRKLAGVMNAIAAATSLSAILVLPVQAAPRDIMVQDTDVYPESIAATPDGTVFLGSLKKPIIYRAAPNADAKPWIHLSGKQPITLGVLADPASKTLWACVHEPIGAPSPTAPNPPPQRSFLRGFDLDTGAVKANYPLAGATNGCNDISIAPDRTVYVTDSGNARLLRLKSGSKALEIWLEDKQNLDGIDGLNFLDGKLYVNNVRTSHIYRIPITSDGKAGTPVDIQLSQPISGPDGMRAEGGIIYIAENREGRISALKLTGDKATVTVLRTGLQVPTGVAPMGKMLWASEAKFNYMRDPKLGNPNPFKVYAIQLQRVTGK